MKGAVYVNGTITPADQAVIPVYDHGFVYGEGVYETLRTYNRLPFLYDRHMRRLRASASALHLDVPFDEPPARMFDEGIRVSLVSTLRNHPGSVNPIIKSNNLLNNAIAMQEAHRKGGEEALMCNYRGELSECSQSNFFLVRDGVALTPRSASGLLEGLTRGFLFEVGRDIGVRVEEATLRPEDLATAQEAFITGSTRELTPVVRIDDQAIGTGRPGPVTRALLAGFRKKAWELSGQGAAAR